MCRSASWHSASGRSGKVPGKRGAAQRTFSGNRVQRMQDVYGEFACGALSSSAEYVVNVFLTSSRRSS
jgi:hypothetical protein